MRPWIPALLLGAAACGSGGDASLRLRLDEGAPLEVFRGPQGGFHVFLSVRAAGVGTRPTIDFDVHDLDAGRPLDRFVPLRLELVPAPDGGGALDLLPPRQVVLDVRSAAEIAGHRLRVTARLVDGGVTLEDTTTAISTPAP